MIRRKDWETRLAEVIERFQRASYQWGVSDCVAIAAVCIDAMYDTAWREELDWASEEGAREAAKRRSVSQWWQDIGAQPIEPVYAHTGDMWLGEVGGLPSVYVTMGRRCVSSTPEHGVITVLLRHMTDCGYQAWRLP